MNYQRTDSDLDHLTSKQKTAFLKLQKMGCPVKIWWQNDPQYTEYRGLFWIDSEEDENDFLEYYDNYWGSDKMNTVLKKAGLYFEWQNSAVACVYEM